jgi:hypothetical protein
LNNFFNFLTMPTALTVQSNASALFNVFNAQVDFINEGNDTNPPFVFTGDTPTNQIISQDQDLTVNVSWNVGGLIPTICKLDYTVTMYLELMGTGATTPYTASVTDGPLSPSTSKSYSTSVLISSGLAVGVYRLVCAMTVKINGAGGLNLPVAGFADCGFIQVFPA